MARRKREPLDASRWGVASTAAEPTAIAPGVPGVGPAVPDQAPEPSPPAPGVEPAAPPAPVQVPVQLPLGAMPY
jgi:hypothetical protein